jgi:hypothetical protein
MADPKAIQFLEAIYSRVDKQVREIVSSMLPPVSVAAQDDGSVVTNEHRILNFQGPGVTVTDDPSNRRSNVYISGSPNGTSTNVDLLFSGNTAARWMQVGTLSGSTVTNWTATVTTPVGTYGMFESSTSSQLYHLPTGLSEIIVTNTGSANQSAFIDHYNTSDVYAGNVQHLNFAIGVAVHITWNSSDANYHGIGINLDNPAVGSYAFTVTYGSGIPAPEPSGWNTSLGFDDAAWTASIVGGTVSYCDNAHTDARISSSEPSSAINLHRRVFPLSLSASLTAAHIKVTADNYMQGVWINGHFVTGSLSTTDLSGTSASLSLTFSESWLNPSGDNLLAVKIQNGSAGMFTAYHVTGDTTAPGTDTQYIPKSIVTTKGDVIVGGSSANPVRLGVGTNGYVLTANSAATNGVDWEAGGGGGMSNPMTTQDDIIVGGSSGTPARLAKGTSGQVLTVNASSGHLDWETPAGGGGSLSTASTNLGSDVSVTTASWTNVLSLSLAAGTWLVWAQAHITMSTNSPGNCRLVIGSTVYAAAEFTQNNGWRVSPVLVSEPLVLASTTSVTMQVLAAGTAKANLVDQPTVPKATYMRALKVA